MNRILARAQRAVLEQFAWSRVLLGFDFDGTLAPIVRDPNAARMRRTTHARLVEVARRYPCAVLSGRGRADVTQRVSGVELVDVVGNHGLESSRSAHGSPAQAHRWERELVRALGHVAGVEVENKGPSLAVHYRKSRARREAKRLVDLAVAALPGTSRVVLGKLVVNVLPKGAPHKGIALQALRKRAKADTAIYVGDDVTDEDVFMLDEPGKLLSIRIGRSATSAAAYYLESQNEIDDLLERLLELRPTDGGTKTTRSARTKRRA